MYARTFTFFNSHFSRIIIKLVFSWFVIFMNLLLLKDVLNSLRLPCFKFLVNMIVPSEISDNLRIINLQKFLFANISPVKVLKNSLVAGKWVEIKKLRSSSFLTFFPRFLGFPVAELLTFFFKFFGTRFRWWLISRSFVRAFRI